MLFVALVFIFFVLLAIAYELHGIAERLIETGTIIEHYSRRDLRRSGILKDGEDDEFGDYITHNHPRWRRIVWAIIGASLLTVAVLKVVAIVSRP